MIFLNSFFILRKFKHLKKCLVENHSVKNVFKKREYFSKQYFRFRLQVVASIVLAIKGKNLGIIFSTEKGDCKYLLLKYTLLDDIIELIEGEYFLFQVCRFKKSNFFRII